MFGSHVRRASGHRIQQPSSPPVLLGSVISTLFVLGDMYVD